MIGITEILVYTLLLLATVSIFLCLGSIKKGKNYPRGPWGFPIIGHLHLMGTFRHKVFTAWKKRFGPVYCLRFGRHRAVVISDYELIKVAMNHKGFAGRPQLSHYVDKCGGEIKGIIYTEGQEWAEQRQLALNHLMDYGCGKKSIETIIHNEIIELNNHLIQLSGEAIPAQVSINAAIINVLCTIITGESLQQENVDFHAIRTQLNTIIQEQNSFSPLAMFLPWFASREPGSVKIIENTGKILSFLREHVEQHKKTFETGQHRDFLDIYLDEIKNTSDPDSSFYREKGMKSSLFTLLDIFVSGSEKLSTTLIWLLLYMTKYPEIQKKLQNEIELVVGKSRLPSLTDRSKMVYTEAVIHETLRFSSFIPLSIFHKTTEEIQFGGFTIPADTLIVPNLYDAHFDKFAWEDPEVFRPERFITSTGEFKPHEAFLAFGIGERACLGENLARDQIFLFTASLFQRFSTLPSNSAPNLSIEPLGSFVLTPKSYDLILKDRF